MQEGSCGEQRKQKATSVTSVYRMERPAITNEKHGHGDIQIYWQFCLHDFNMAKVEELGISGIVFEKVLK